MTKKFSERVSYISDGSRKGAVERRERIAAYVDWLLLPKDVRSPSTKSEYAAQNGMSPSTLNSWELDLFFQKTYMQRRQAAFKVNSLEDVLQSLLEIATDRGNRNAVGAANALLRWAEEAVGISEADRLDLNELTEEEAVTILGQFVHNEAATS